MLKKLKELTADNITRLSINTAKHYANVACPLITYQPKINKDVKKLRRF